MGRVGPGKSKVFIVFHSPTLTHVTQFLFFQQEPQTEQTFKQKISKHKKILMKISPNAKYIKKKHFL
jgi:hypothetical protein